MASFLEEDFIDIKIRGNMKKMKAIATLIFFICSSSALYAAKEAPMLAKMVKSGKLPPLEQRLPEKPLVEKPVSEIGKYGGKLVLGTAFFLDDERYPARLDRNGFFQFTYPFPSDGPIKPNLAESWKWNDAGTELYSSGSQWEDENLTTTSGLTKWFEPVSGFPPGWHTYCADVTIKDDSTGEIVGFGEDCQYLNKDEPGLGDDCSGITSSDYLMVTDSSILDGTMNGRYERGFGWAAEGVGSADVIPDEDTLYWYQTQDGDGNTFEEWAFYKMPDDTSLGDWAVIRNTNPPSDTEGSSIYITSAWGDNSCHPEGDDSGNFDYGNVIHHTESFSDEDSVHAELVWNPNDGKLDIIAHAYSDSTNQVVIGISVDSFDSGLETTFTHAADSGTLSLDGEGRVTFSNVMDLYSAGLVSEHTYCVTFTLGDRSDGDNEIARSIGCMFFGNSNAIDSSTVEWSSDVSTWVSQTSSNLVGFEGSNIIDGFFFDILEIKLRAS